MKYAGMPMGIWLLFSASFRKRPTNVLQYDAQTAKRIAAQAKPKYKKILARLPEFEKGDRFKKNVVSCLSFSVLSHFSALCRPRPLCAVLPECSHGLFLTDDPDFIPFTDGSSM